MAFFFSNNPIALFLALVVVISILKLFLEKRKWFQGGKSSYIIPLLIILAIILISYQPMLRILSIGIPFLALIAIFLFCIGGILFALGMPRPQIWPALKDVGPLRTAAYIAIFCIIAFAVSRVYGEQLLEEKTVSIADAITPQQEEVKIDFSPIFTQQALGLIVVFIVLGSAMVFVNFTS